MNRRNKNQDIQKELQAISPLLAEMRKKDDGFLIPKNYFKNLPEEILEKVETVSNKTTAEEEKNWNTWLDPLLSALQILLYPRYAMAVTAIGFLIAAGLWLRSDEHKLSDEVVWSDITTEEMTAYIEANIHEFEVGSLVEFVPDLEGQSILLNTDIEEEILNGYLKEIIDEVEFEDLKNLF